ncbi:MAG: hypothetical protein Q8R18_01260, partial [bacterium]|nr:hypothetical protein [bacterium]
MKRGIVLIAILIILIPIVQAVPAAPYFIISEDGSFVPTDSLGTNPLNKKDKERFENPDSEVGKKIMEQFGDHDYSEVYDIAQCPVAFQKDATGKRRPYIGKLDEKGYF